MEQVELSEVQRSAVFLLGKQDEFWTNTIRRYKNVTPSSEAKKIQNSYPYEFPSIISPLLYSPIFSKFLEDLDSAKITVEDREAALSFDEASKEDLGVNTLVTEALKKCLNMDEKRIGRLKLPLTGRGGKQRETDVTVKFEKYIAINVVLKKQNGQGDAVHKNIAYFLAHYANIFSKDLPNGVLPAFLMTQFGRIVSVHDSVQVTELTHLEMAGPLSRDFDKQVRLFAALRNGCKQLEEYYKNLDNAKKSVQNFFPWKKEFESASSRNKFAFIKKIERLVFDAIITESEDKKLIDKHVIVKFAKKYSADVHNFFAQRGVSPLLYSCEKMTPEKSSYFMIVMEKIEGEPLFNFQEKDKIDFEGLKQAVAEAHKAGFVHGDLRNTNILVDEKGIIKLIDFDWAGKIGEATYPSTMNINAKPRQWSEDAIPLGPILPKHDDELLEIIFTGLPIASLTLNESC